MKMVRLVELKSILRIVIICIHCSFVAADIDGRERYVESSGGGSKSGELATTEFPTHTLEPRWTLPESNQQRHEVSGFENRSASRGLKKKSAFNHQDRNVKRNMVSTFSKQIDCGLVRVHEDSSADETRHVDDEQERESDEPSRVDAAAHAPRRRRRREKRLVANLSSCLGRDQGALFSAFATHMNSKLAQAVFAEHFALDDKTGHVYLVSEIGKHKVLISFFTQKAN